MKRFADLYDALDGTTSTLAKVAAMISYFQDTPPADAAWGLFFLTGRRLKRLIAPSRLAEWTYQLTGLPGWLVEESYAVAGDLAETTALLLDSGVRVDDAPSVPLSEWIERRLLPLKPLALEAQQAIVEGWWSSLPRRELYLLNKLLTGELRVGVSSTLVVRALSELSNVPAPTLSHRLMGAWEPTAEWMRRLLVPDVVDDDLSRPYPFYLASPLEAQPESLGPREAWLTEWKWDGIRAQLIRRADQTFLWSRGEELITERFPELVEAAGSLSGGTVLDGEVLAWRDGKPLPFSVLQRRIGRKVLGPKVLRDAPVVFMAFDLLEREGVDVRTEPLSQRRAWLASMLSGAPGVFLVSPEVEAPTWETLGALRLDSRAREVEGLMFKRLDSPYRTGRKRGDWWKWKVQPYSMDAVLIYAHPGHGRRANLFTDFTFAVWSDGELVPVAKAYSGLTDAELVELDRWVRSHTRERFGPVRAVEPSRVYELHFEAIAPSSRHRSGIAVRFPRIARERVDKKPEDADTVERLRALVVHPGT